ncbi:hypothetical protein N431DRAFT_487062 [Stipitochalara longipes BDJ]|nr:hypothetical protein N431DRAFT_487062 [Stipitochalara longipes BDJ]
MFQNLATEIRLKIWRATFPPPRRVDVGIFGLRFREMSKPSHPPISLFVNQESRKETQRHYEVIYYDYEISSLSKERFKRVTFFSPQRDVLVIDGEVAIFRVNQLKAAVSQLSVQLSAGLGSIRAIEFKNLNWVVVFVHPLPGDLHQRPNIWWVIKEFRGLRTIDFTMPFASSEVYSGPCKAVVEAFLEKHKQMYDGGVPPKVTFVPHSEGQPLES